MATAPAKISIGTWLGLLWSMAVILAYFWANKDYYSLKLTSFGAYALRLLSGQ